MHTHTHIQLCWLCGTGTAVLLDTKPGKHRHKQDGFNAAMSRIQDTLYNALNRLKIIDVIYAELTLFDFQPLFFRKSVQIPVTFIITGDNFKDC